MLMLCFCGCGKQQSEKHINPANNTINKTMDMTKYAIGKVADLSDFGINQETKIVAAYGVDVNSMQCKEYLSKVQPKMPVMLIAKNGKKSEGWIVVWDSNTKKYKTLHISNEEWIFNSTNREVTMFELSNGDKALLLSVNEGEDVCDYMILHIKNDFSINMVVNSKEYQETNHLLPDDKEFQGEYLADFKVQLSYPVIKYNKIMPVVSEDGPTMEDLTGERIEKPEYAINHYANWTKDGKVKSDSKNYPLCLGKMLSVSVDQNDRKKLIITRELQMNKEEFSIGQMKEIFVCGDKKNSLELVEAIYEQGEEIDDTDNTSIDDEAYSACNLLTPLVKKLKKKGIDNIDQKSLKEYLQLLPVIGDNQKIEHLKVTPCHISGKENKDYVINFYCEGAAKGTGVVIFLGEKDGQYRQMYQSKYGEYIGYTALNNLSFWDVDNDGVDEVYLDYALVHTGIDNVICVYKFTNYCANDVFEKIMFMGNDKWYSYKCKRMNNGKLVLDIVKKWGDQEVGKVKSCKKYKEVYKYSAQKGKFERQK